MTDREAAEAALAGAIGLIVFIVAALVIWGSIAWAIIWIAWGFGVAAPFWPTFAAVALVLVLLGVIRRSGKS